jgi:hypothetical protein
MRRALRQNRARAQTAVARSIPAPIGGWDTESALADMPPQNAVILENWIPRGSYCQMRRGFVEQCTGTPAAVETLIAWHGPQSGDKLFAASGAYLFDVTAAGALPSAAYASAATARWNWTNFANAAGKWAILCNGAQNPLKYDGSSWSTNIPTGTGLTATNLKYVMNFKTRLHYAEDNSLVVWVTATSAIAGACTKLDLGPIFAKGGYLVGLGRLTLDGGNGPDDYACYLTNQGEVAIYKGSDPSDATNWFLVGVYTLAKPIGDRAILAYGPDLLILTEVGLLSLSQALSTPIEEQRKNSVSRQVATAFADAAKAYGSNFGWQPVLYGGRGGLLIVNVPTAELSTSEQYVRSTSGNAWCRFTGIPAFCWAQANGMVYFGSAAGIYQWDVGASDNGEFIVADALPSFQAFGNRAVRKAFSMVRALMFCPSIVKPSLQVVTDFDKSTIPTAIPSTVDAGDISPTDSTVVRDDWTGAAGSGYFGSPRLRVSLAGSATADRVAVTADHADLALIGPSGTDPTSHILTRPNLPLDVEVQLLGFDLMFEGGAVL